MVKDCADIIALIDPVSGGREIDLEILGAQVSNFPFLKNIILRIPGIDSVQERYGRLSPFEIGTLCENLESII